MSVIGQCISECNRLTEIVTTLEAENAEQAAEIERLKADGARLDWVFNGSHVHYSGQTLGRTDDSDIRPFIDAAMKAPPQ